MNEWFQMSQHMAGVICWHMFFFGKILLPPYKNSVYHPAYWQQQPFICTRTIYKIITINIVKLVESTACPK